MLVGTRDARLTAARYAAQYSTEKHGTEWCGLGNPTAATLAGHSGPTHCGRLVAGSPAACVWPPSQFMFNSVCITVRDAAQPYSERRPEGRGPARHFRAGF